MPICNALNKYGLLSFKIYILETFNKDISPKNLMLAEYKWVSIINPSYNIQAIIDPFKDINHYRYGKILTNEIKLKISNTLKNRIVSEEKIKNHIIGAKNK